ncbi:SCO family protein [Crocinitomicaceae bacterium]|jgi:protein SCO1/2|nr:SCO family protein [Crocinitomicaceae bacterium]MDC1266574.1 SCO family protein [Crocinitomicaceae bacterium]
MKRIIFVFIILMIAIPVAYYYTIESNKKKLPIINPSDLVPDVVDPELRNKASGHKIQDFEFVNQNGDLIKSKELEGKIWVVEYFFATCKGICPIMNKQMQRVQSAYSDDNEIKILSFTVDPINDSIEALKKYAESHEAINGKWHFFTGNKTKLYGLARQSFFLLKPAEAKNLGDAGGDFIHTNNFVLIDPQKRIRGYYDGTNPDEVDELIADIGILKAE